MSPEASLAHFRPAGLCNKESQMFKCKQNPSVLTGCVGDAADVRGAGAWPDWNEPGFPRSSGPSGSFWKPLANAVQESHTVKQSPPSRPLTWAESPAHCMRKHCGLCRWDTSVGGSSIEAPSHPGDNLFESGISCDILMTQPCAQATGGLL